MGYLQPTKLDADGEAFAALYRRHFGLVWSLTLHMGVPAAAREDVAQEVWITIHRRMHSLRADASVRAWVASITRNVAMHHRRADGRRHRKHAALTVVTGVNEGIHDADAITTIDDTLRAMDPAQRETFVLVAVAELSGPEVAEVLGVPLNTVYSRLRLARARLATALTEAQEREAAMLLREAPQQQRAASRVWLAVITDLGWRDAAPALMTAASTTFTGKLAVVAISALATVMGTAALGGRGDRSAHAGAVASAVAPRDASASREPAPHEPAPDEPVAPAEPLLAPPLQEPTSIAPPVVHHVDASAARTTARTEVAPRRESKQEPPHESPTAPIVDALAAEAALLSQARRALSDGDPARARELLTQQAREFPEGRLAIDRRAAWVRMLCAAGESTQARYQLKKLLRDHPGAAAAVAVRDVCADE